MPSELKCKACSEGFETIDRFCPKCGERVTQPLQAGDSGGGFDTMEAMDVGDVQFRLGMVFFKKGAYARALEVWAKVLERQPENNNLKSLMADAKDRKTEAL